MVDLLYSVLDPAGAAGEASATHDRRRRSTRRSRRAPRARETPFRRFVSDFCESRLALFGLVPAGSVASLRRALRAADLAAEPLRPGAARHHGRPAAARHGLERRQFTYWLGTDDQGRDMLSAIIYGLRISLIVGAVSAVIACLDRRRRSACWRPMPAAASTRCSCGSSTCSSPSRRSWWR